LVLTLGVGLQADAAVARAAKTWPCYWTRGRLWIAQGGHPIRLWPVGTRRILGIENPKPGPIDYDGADAIPPRVSEVLTDGVFVWGNYHVCPIAPERAGWMRFVFIDRAKGKVFVQKRTS
jgi:hypothetical protein